MSRYGVKEVSLGIVALGAMAGQRVVQVELTGCNLWDGNPLNREETGAPCALWCDGDFAKGRVLTAAELVAEAVAAHASTSPQGEVPWVWLAGGEPAIQLDNELVDAFFNEGFRIGVETNGTRDNKALRACSHIVCSPKLGAPVKLYTAHELRVSLPGGPPDKLGWTLDDLDQLSRAGVWASKYVHPIDPLVEPREVGATLLRLRGSLEDQELEALLAATYAAHLGACLSVVQRRPAWRLSLSLARHRELVG